MNCKPGDLCMVVKASDAQHELLTSIHLLGRTVTVTKLKDCGKKKGWWPFRRSAGPFLWELKEPVRVGLMVVSAIHDDLLKPIRDPGEDARDETLAWKPVPAKEEVPA